MSARPHFRPDIEGLRGVAILLVVLFHAGVTSVAGGFVGVDVFFVLSGFFITGLLVREAGDAQGVALTGFYGRRALRLLPSLLVVLLATLGLVMWQYAPIDRAPIAANARSVALYSANVAFAREAVDYFSSGENPLLHTWSLAVEEQFYFVWPLVFLAVAFVVGRRRARWSTAGEAGGVALTPLRVAIAVAGALSFALSLWLTRVAPSWAFFGMPTRVWEFALGGALAVMSNDRGEGEGRDAWATALQLAGVAAIAFGVFTYDRATPYPGWAALLPAGGAVALLVGGARAPESVVSRTLALSPLRWLGRLSYAWYLWHWPLVGLGAVLDREIGTAGRLAWSAAALGLAWLTYRFVEHPAREGRLFRIPEHRLAPTALAVSVFAALVANGAMVSAERTAAGAAQRPFAAAREDRMRHGCWGTTAAAWTGPCAFGDVRSSTTVVLLGDSHAEHWLGALDRLGRERGWRVVALVKGGCPVADAPELGMARPKHYASCAAFREAMVRRLIALRPAAAVLSSWDHYMPIDRPGGGKAEGPVTPDAWRGGLRRTYARLSAAGIPTVALRGTPRTWFDVPSCLSRRAAGLLFADTCEYAQKTSLSPAAVAAQTAAARGLGVRFVDMNDQICPTGAARCGVVRNGVIVFTDDNHLTASFSRSVAPTLGARLDVALAELGRRLP